MNPRRMTITLLMIAASVVTTILSVAACRRKHI